MTTEREELARVLSDAFYCDGSGHALWGDLYPREREEWLLVADAGLAHLRARGWHPESEIVGRIEEGVASWKLGTQLAEDRAEAAERALADTQENEGLAIRDFSDLLTGGNAGTWGQLYHAARELRAALTSARLEHAQLVGEWERMREALVRLLQWFEQVHNERYEHSGAMNATRLSERDIGRKILKAAHAALTPPSPGKG